MFLNNKIKNIKAKEILDSRGNPTIEALVETNKFSVSASVPSGASKGRYEAKELRDNDERFDGKGVLQAVKNINEIISPKLNLIDVLNQNKIDRILIDLDGTNNKSRLGANAILAVSIACCKAGAKTRNQPLYSYINKLEPGFKKPEIDIKMCFNVVNGGSHSNSKLAIQEFFIIPQKESISESLRIATEVYHFLGRKLKDKYGFFASNIGDEGGFVPPTDKTEEVLDLILESIKEKGYSNDFKLGIDCAASSFYKDGKYYIDGKEMSKKDLSNFYQNLIEKYELALIEDPFSEDDFGSFNEFNEKFGNKINILGDDLTVTNFERVKLAEKNKCCDGMIIKPNQIGTITETLKVIKLAKSFNWKILTSHRSGETCDSFIADFAVGVNSDFAKFGAPVRGERTSKYNRLLQIEKEINPI